jgi:hypothetical protein
MLLHLQRLDDLVYAEIQEMLSNTMCRTVHRPSRKSSISALGEYFVSVLFRYHEQQLTLTKAITAKVSSQPKLFLMNVLVYTRNGITKHVMINSAMVTPSRILPRPCDMTAVMVPEF